jgi:ABC-2 type transport system permease protein
LEPILGAAVSRSRWLLSHVTWAVLGSGLLLLVLGAATGLAYGLVTGDVAGKTVRLAGAAAIWWPATLALGAVVVALFGVVPRLTVALSWAVLTMCLLMGQIGALLDLPQAVLNISPFTHVPAVPAADVSALPLALLAAAALALAAIGLLSFRRRDLAM